MKNIKTIRLNHDNGVSHFSTKYYFVEHDEITGEDKLKLKGDDKVLYTVQATLLNGTTIVYKDIS